MARSSAPITVCSEHLFRTLSENHPQDHQNHKKLTRTTLRVVLVVLGVALVILGVVLRQCPEQMFGTDSVRNSVPSQLSLEQLKCE